MFTEFFLDRFSHLKQFYGTEEEFREHLLSGEVTVPIADVIKIYNDFELANQNQNLPNADTAI